MKNFLGKVFYVIIFAIILFVFAFRFDGPYMHFKGNDYRIEHDEFYDNKESNEPGRYYSDQLRKYQRIIYKAMMNNKENLKEGNYVIDFGYIFTEKIKEKSINMFFEDEKESMNNDLYLMEAFKYAAITFLIENPDMYFIDLSKWKINIESEKRWYLSEPVFHVYICGKDGGSYFEEGINSKSDVEKMDGEIKSVADVVISEAKTKANDYEKIKYVHDYLIDNISYDESLEASNTHNMYGALVNKTCVCDGYANAFQYLMLELGINSMNIPGYTTAGETEYHQWNAVELDGKWYMIDVTWDDPVIVGSNGTAESAESLISEERKHKWFLLGRLEHETIDAETGVINDHHYSSWRMYQKNYDRSNDVTIGEDGKATINFDMPSMDEMMKQRIEKLKKGDIDISINFPMLNIENYNK